jgi:hypothetical protein
MRIGPISAIVGGWVPLFLLGCAPGEGLPEGATIFSGPSAESIFEQCSRRSPERGEGAWQPAPDHVRRFESRLAAELPRRIDGLRDLWPAARERLQGFPSGYRREYVGIVRSGRRYLYGNFVPLDALEPFDSAVEEGPASVCDGGPVFFGAEYDAASDAVTHLDFNVAI